MPKNKLPLALLILLLIPCWGIAWKPGGDLGVYYKASQWLQNGLISTLYSNNAEIGNFFYGPFGLALLKPLSSLSFENANRLWLFLQTLSYSIFWFFLFKLFPELWDSQRRWLFILTWVVSIKPIHASFQSHNVQLIFAALLILSEWFSNSEKKAHQLLSGILVVLLASIKIYPGFIALYYFLIKRPQVKWGLFLGGLISLVFPALTFGIKSGFSLPVEFIQNALHYHQVYDLSKDVVSLSLPSLLTTWLPSAWISKGAVTLIVGSVSLFYFCWAFTQRKVLNFSENRNAWALLWTTMAMLNSTTRPDYFIYFVPSFASLPLLIEHSSKKLIYQLGTFISILLIAFITEWTLGSRELTHYLESIRIPVLGIILLCLMQFLAVRNKIKE